MPNRRFCAEPIATLFRQIEVLMAQGKSVRRPAGKLDYRSRVLIAGARCTAGLRSIRRSG
jgi:hypothetical protein